MPRTGASHSNAGNAATAAGITIRTREGAANEDVMGLHGEPRNVGSLRTPRYGAQAVLLASDQVLVTGGATASDEAGTATLGSAEFYTVHPAQLRARSAE